MYTHFLLGEIRITEPARLALKRIPFDLICRHAINEHGRITDEEAAANAIGMQTLGPIVSRYRLDPTDASSVNVLVKTRATWSETLIALDDPALDVVVSDMPSPEEPLPF